MKKYSYSELETSLQYVLNDYREAYGSKKTNHPLAHVIQQDIPNLLREIITDNKRYLIKGSSGTGPWALVPWIAIFDTFITRSAGEGYYPVFLFKDDMSGVYLSLNQGVTRLKKIYKKSSKDILRLKAEDYRAQIPNNDRFNLQEINLKSLPSSSDLAELYEAGNIIARYYPASNFPSKKILKGDVVELLRIYSLLSYNDCSPINFMEKEDDEEGYTAFENLKKFRLHKRIERNQYLSRKVKKIQGYVCKACKMDFSKVYGELGIQYIEAHHLKPLSHLDGEKIQLDAKKDFTVLCSNCHRMIHRLNDPSDLNYLISLINKHNS